MTRVTRSKKVEIAEDDTALTMENQLVERNDQQAGALAENDKTTNAMSASKKSPSTSELNGLKAAFRDAIGMGKKSKKRKGKKKGNKQDMPVEEEGLVTSTQVDDANQAGRSVPEPARELLQNPEEENTPMNEDRAPTPPPAVRATRQQLAKSQAGQYDEMILSQHPQPRSRVPSVSWLPWEHTDLYSLYNGRSISRGFSDRIAELDIAKKNPTDSNLTLAEAAPPKLKRSTRRNKQVDEPSEPDTKASQEEATSVHIEDISTSTPAPIGKTLEDVEKACAEDEAVAPIVKPDEDSFVEQITSRSPAKPVSRIEDSLEALDQLEEALEAVDQAALAEEIGSPEKPHHYRDSANLDKAVRDANGALHKTASIQPKVKLSSATVRVKSAPNKAASVQRSQSMRVKSTKDAKQTVDSKTFEPPKRAPVKRPASLLPPKQPAKSTKPATRPTFELPGEAVARKLKEQREARLAQRDSEDGSRPIPTVSAPVIKSTKAPTRSTFELPGEALSRRKREAHEARVKAQEEEERKKREFKARPVRKSAVPTTLPRETIASRARQSKVGLESIESMHDGGMTVPKQRGSNVGAHRPSIHQLNLANMSAPRSPGTGSSSLCRHTSTTSNAPSIGSRTVIGRDIQGQRQRAKDIYSRDARLAEDMEREKKEREAAAKRSREEAAERGRQASREWAERQRAKKLAEAAEKGVSGLKA